MTTQLRRERQITLPCGAGTLLVRVFRPGGRRRGFADADEWDPDHLGLNLVLAGQGAYRIGRRSWPLVPGTVFLRRPGLRHSTWGSAGYAECSLGFAAAWTPHLAALGALPDEVVVAGPPQAQTADDLAVLAADMEFEAGPPLVARAMAIALAMLQRATRGEDAIARARRAIEEDPATAPRLAALAARAGLSPTAFRRAFTAAVGAGPMAYRQRLRLDTAEHLLRRGHLVKEVAARLGYPSPEALCVQYRARYGFPPGRRHRVGTVRRARGDVR